MQSEKKNSTKERITTEYIIGELHDKICRRH